MALQLVITNAGRAAVIDQGSGGFVAVRIAGVGVSATTVNATPEATSLPGEVKRIATIAGEATAGDVAHLTITDESSDSYTVRSFALYLSNGTLFAIYGQTEPIVQKSAQALLLLAVDVMLSNIPASVITFGNANFTNPAATTERAGVVELAADDEVAAGLDRVRAVTPRGLRQNYAQLRSADFTGLVTVKNQGGECFRAYGTGTSYAMYDAPGGGRLGYLMHDGLDLLVGNEAAGGIRFLFRGSAAATLSAGGAWNTIGTITRAGNVVWDIGNDGAGSGLDADLLDGQQGGWYADIPARLGFTPVQQGTGIGQNAANVVKIGWSSGRLLATVDATNLGAFVFENHITDVWRITNDGAGSGLDADLLDGRHATDFALRSGADFNGLVSVRSSGGEAFRSYGTGTSYAMYDAPGGGRLGYLMHDGLDLLVGNEAAGGIRFLFRGSAAATLSAGGAWNTVGTITRAGNVVWDIGNDGAGSGLDADLLDGQQGGWYADITARLGFTPVQQGTGIGQSAANVVKIGWSSGRLLATVDATNLGAIVFEKDMADVWRVGNDGAGSGLDADLLDGWHRDDIRLWTNLLGIPPLWTPGNDGAGSGLDADLLDGWHRDEIRDWGTILNKPGSFPAAAHTHGAADIAGAFTGSLSGNGYTVLPNGLILQWVTGAQQAAGFEGTQSVVFPIAFPNTCFQVIASTQVANPNTESHATYQLINYSNETATVMRQLVSSAGADREPSWPRLFAVGR